MLPSNKNKIFQYYVTINDIYQIESNKLIKLGNFNEVKENTTFKFTNTCKIFLAAECYKIFMNAAAMLYSPKQFQMQVEQRFKLCFPHLNVTQYCFFYDEPAFNTPYFAVAVDIAWYNNFLRQFEINKLAQAHIVPLATYIYAQQTNQNLFCFKEYSLETHFIHLEGQLHQIIQKNKNITEANHFNLLDQYV